MAIGDTRRDREAKIACFFCNNIGCVRMRVWLWNEKGMQLFLVFFKLHVSSDWHTVVSTCEIGNDGDRRYFLFQYGIAQNDEGKEY